MAQRERPDLILLDIHMSGMDGYEAARRLRKESKLESTPLVAVTALAMVGDREKILRAGFDGYIAKPIDPENFVRQIDKYLQNLEGATSRRATPLVTGTDPNSMAPALAPPTPKGVSVLVVDNSPVNIQVLRGTLEPSGYQVASATDVKEAMTTLRMNPPDLIVSNVHMPGLSGYDFIQSIKADSRLRKIPFMFVSSTHLTNDDRTLALTLGADKFVTRPIEPQKLLAEIEDLLSRCKGGYYNYGDSPCCR